MGTELTNFVRILNGPSNYWTKGFFDGIEFFVWIKEQRRQKRFFYCRLLLLESPSNYRTGWQNSWISKRVRPIQRFRFKTIGINHDSNNKWSAWKWYASSIRWTIFFFDQRSLITAAKAVRFSFLYFALKMEKRDADRQRDEARLQISSKQQIQIAAFYTE